MHTRTLHAKDITPGMRVVTRTGTLLTVERVKRAEDGRVAMLTSDGKASYAQPLLQMRVHPDTPGSWLRSEN